MAVCQQQVVQEKSSPSVFDEKRWRAVVGDDLFPRVVTVLGLHANAAMWIDPALKNTCFLDPVGGSVSFYDTHVRLEKV